MAFPDRAADGHFAHDGLEDALPVDPDLRVLFQNRGERRAALETHLETQVVEPEHQAIGGPLRRRRPRTRAPGGGERRSPGSDRSARR